MGQEDTSEGGLGLRNREQCPKLTSLGTDGLITRFSSFSAWKVRITYLTANKLLLGANGELRGTEEKTGEQTYSCSEKEVEQLVGGQHSHSDMLGSPLHRFL